MADQNTTIPKGWKMTTLGNQLKVGRGSSPRPIQDFISDRGIPWVKIADASASETRYIYKTKQCIKEEGRSTSVNVGDLIVSNSATPGIPKIMGIDACVHDGWLVFSEYTHLDRLYLYYFFLDYRRILTQSASGTVFVNLQTEIVRNIGMMLPPTPEQSAIAAVLSSLDDKIELLREQNKTLEATAQALFKEWFVKFNYPGATGKMIDSELGKIPEKWRVGSLEDITSRITDGSHFSPKTLDNGYPMASVKDMTDWGINIDSCRKIAQHDYDELVRSDCRPLKNDILIAKDGSFLKHIFLVPEDLKVVVLSSIAIIRPNARYSPVLLTSLLKSDVVMKQLESIVSGAVIRRIVLKDFRKFKIVIPADNVQLKAQSVLNPIYDKCWNNNSQIQTLSTLRDTLLPKLMKGEVRVERFNN